MGPIKDRNESARILEDQIANYIGAIEILKIELAKNRFSPLGVFQILRTYKWLASRKKELMDLRKDVKFEDVQKIVLRKLKK